VLIDDDDVEATVFFKDGEWGGVWNGASDRQPRVLKAKYEDADRVIELMDQAIVEGAESSLWWEPALTWRKTKDRKGWYCKVAGGAVASVKQAKTGSWYASRMGEAMLGRHGRAEWFASAEEAKQAVAQTTIDGSQWEWVSRLE
jgi:hypothetical protein